MTLEITEEEDNCRLHNSVSLVHFLFLLIVFKINCDLGSNTVEKASGSQAEGLKFAC